MAQNPDPRSSLPQVEQLLSMREAAPLLAQVSRQLARERARLVLADMRQELAAAPAAAASDTRAEARTRFMSALRALSRRRLCRVLNGTGVVLHTNLGRSPLSPDILAQAATLGSAYSNLEFDLETGARGGRGGLVPELLAAISGAQAGLAVNNNAAAVLLALSALAPGKEVLVSRAHAVQIGGGFRVPEILALSGARLVDVGTTNITTADDYVRAVGPDTAAVLLVHGSNFALRGFVQSPAVAELRAALPRRIPLLVDQGSGCTGEAIPGETPLSDLVRDGADLVCWSGDKLFGGPQAGLVAGRRALVQRMARHPLMRAFRPGKTILALLEATLIARLSGSAGLTTMDRALARSRESGLAALSRFGETLLARLDPDMRTRCELVPSQAAIGGGSSPDEHIPSLAIRLRAGVSARQAAARMRQAQVPLIARVEGGSVLVDLIALADEDPAEVAAALRAAFGADGA